MVIAKIIGLSGVPMQCITSQNGSTVQERILIKIDIIAQFWHHPPMIDMLIDGVVVSQDVIDKKKYSIKNTVNLDINQIHLLQLRRYNKSDDQCVIVDGIKKDQYVIIDSVVIDGVNIQNLIWHRSWYEPQYPEVWAEQQKSAGVDLEPKVIGETWLSHNGTWNFEFSSPFYKFVISQFIS